MGRRGLRSIRRHRRDSAERPRLQREVRARLRRVARRRVLRLHAGIHGRLPVARHGRVGHGLVLPAVGRSDVLVAAPLHVGPLRALQPVDRMGLRVLVELPVLQRELRLGRMVPPHGTTAYAGWGGGCIAPADGAGTGRAIPRPSSPATAGRATAALRNRPLPNAPRRCAPRSAGPVCAPSGSVRLATSAPAQANLNRLPLACATYRARRRLREAHCGSASSVYDQSGQVYRRTKEGQWQQRDAGRWKTTNTGPSGKTGGASGGAGKPAGGSGTTARPSTGFARPAPHPELDRDFSARQRGDARMKERAQQQQQHDRVSRPVETQAKPAPQRSASPGGHGGGGDKTRSAEG